MPIYIRNSIRNWNPSFGLEIILLSFWHICLFGHKKLDGDRPHCAVISFLNCSRQMSSQSSKNFMHELDLHPISYLDFLVKFLSFMQLISPLNEQQFLISNNVT